MKLLAIDTSTTLASVALTDGTDLHSGPGLSTDGGRHGRQLLPTIAALLDLAGVAPRQLDAIAVGLGPGSYTGLRVGLTAAKTLAYALGKPIVGIDSFEAVARNAPLDASSIIVVGDAQRGDLYVEEFARDRLNLPPRSLGPIRVVAALEWAALLPEGIWVVGSGLDRLRIAWPDHVRVGSVDRSTPRAEHLIAIGVEAALAGRFVVAETVEPTYIRRSAAEGYGVISPRLEHG